MKIIRPPINAKYKFLRYWQKYEVDHTVKVIGFDDYLKVGGGGQSVINPDRAYMARTRMGMTVGGSANSFEVFERHRAEKFWTRVICDRHF